MKANKRTIFWKISLQTAAINFKCLNCERLLNKIVLKYYYSKQKLIQYHSMTQNREGKTNTVLFIYFTFSILDDNIILYAVNSWHSTISQKINYYVTHITSGILLT